MAMADKVDKLKKWQEALGHWDTWSQGIEETRLG